MKYIIIATGAVVILIGVLHFFLVRPAQNPEKDAPRVSIEQNPSEKEEDGLLVQDVKVGEGAEAKAGNTVFVHYVGTLTNGTKFDSSRDRGQPFSFTLGRGGVIRGWEQGIPGMKVGGVRKLIIPPELAYGERSIGAIPANATLTFEVELLEVQ